MHFKLLVMCLVCMRKGIKEKQEKVSIPYKEKGSEPRKPCQCTGVLHDKQTSSLVTLILLCYARLVGAINVNSTQAVVVYMTH